MNFSHSTTDKTEKLKDTKALTFQWETMDWCKIKNDVNRLQSRIAKATANGERNKVKRLQYLLTHSFSAKAYAVRKVTTNQGKNTSGVDKKLWSTSASKMKAVLQLTDRKYRAMQTLYALALEPVAEATAGTVSFGFRKGRNAKDAGEQIFCVLARKCSPKWIVEGDIKGDCRRLKTTGEGLFTIPWPTTIGGKTAITHNDNGFDFLGWTFRKFKGKLIVNPSKEAIKRVVRKLSDMILRKARQVLKQI